MSCSGAIIIREMTVSFFLISMASLQYVFSIIPNDTVHALTVAENIGSQKVLVKCGFQFTGAMLHEEAEVMIFELKKT